MSHDITTTDRLVLAGAPAWHGLGTVLPERCTVDDARTLALPWDPVAVPLYVDKPLEGRKVPIAHRAVVRSDSGAVLGVVGPDYEVLGNGDIAGLIEALGAEGLAVETAGSIRGGREVFFLVDRGAFDVAPGDTVRRYVLFTSAHDGTRAFRALPTTVRVVCANTLTVALGQRGGAAFRHARGIRANVIQARDAILGLDAALDRRQAAARALSVRTVTDEGLGRLLGMFYRALAPDRVAAIERGLAQGAPRKDRQAGERADRHRRETVARWIDGVAREEDRVPAIAGTAWAALQAVTEDVEHGEFTRASRDPVGSRLLGTRQTRVRTAYAVADALVGAGS